MANGKGASGRTSFLVGVLEVPDLKFAAPHAMSEEVPQGRESLPAWGSLCKPPQAGQASGAPLSPGPPFSRFHAHHGVTRYFKSPANAKTCLAGAGGISRVDGLHFLPPLWPLRALHPLRLAQTTCCLWSRVCFLGLAVQAPPPAPSILSVTFSHVCPGSLDSSALLLPALGMPFPSPSLPVQIHPYPKPTSSMQPSWIS